MEVVRVGDPDFPSFWRALDASDTQQRHALYGEANLAYYREYLGSDEIVDCSFLLIEGETPVAGMRMFVRRHHDGQSELSCCGLPMLYLENSGAAPAFRARAHKLVKAELLRLTDSSIGPDCVLYRDPLHGGYLSHPGRVLLDLGANAVPGFTQIIDLASPDDELHRGMTKSFKWGVNWGEKNLDLTILDGSTMSGEVMEAFRLLHVDAAGRETRSRRSWELQQAMVMADEAFCVFGSLDGHLVTAALFPRSVSHCFYGVSASRRDLFDKPLTHALIWTALRHAKALGLRHFEMGEQLFPAAGDLQPTAKELGISFFKRAFGGRTKAHLDIRLARRKPEENPAASLEPDVS